MKPNECRCAQCGVVFEKAWSDEEARAEQNANGFNDMAEDDLCVVCDDCYQEIAGRLGLITDFQANPEVAK